MHSKKVMSVLRSFELFLTLAAVKLVPGASMVFGPPGGIRVCPKLRTLSYGKPASNLILYIQYFYIYFALLVKHTCSGKDMMINTNARMTLPGGKALLTIRSGIQSSMSVLRKLGMHLTLSMDFIPLKRSSL